MKEYGGLYWSVLVLMDQIISLESSLMIKYMVLGTAEPLLALHSEELLQ